MRLERVYIVTRRELAHDGDAVLEDVGRCYVLCVF